MQADQRGGVGDEAAGRFCVHCGVDAAAGHLHEDEHHDEGPLLPHEREDTEQRGPGKERDPQKPVGPHTVGEVRSHGVGRARDGDGHGEQHTDLRVGEGEGVLDVEEHHGPATPEDAEQDESGDHRACAGEQAFVSFYAR